MNVKKHRTLVARILATTVAVGVLAAVVSFNAHTLVQQSAAQGATRAAAASAYLAADEQAADLLPAADAELNAARAASREARPNVGEATKNIDELDSTLQKASAQLESLARTQGLNTAGVALATDQPDAWQRLWSQPNALARDTAFLDKKGEQLDTAAVTLGETLDTIAALTAVVGQDVQAETARLAAEEAARIAAEEAARIAAEEAETTTGGGYSAGAAGAGADPLSRHIPVSIIQSLSEANVVFDGASCDGGSATYSCGMVWTNDPWTVHLSANTDWAAAGSAGAYVAAHEAMHVRHFGNLRSKLDTMYPGHMELYEQAADCATAQLGYGAHVYGCPGGTASEIGSLLANG